MIAPDFPSTYSYDIMSKANWEREMFLAGYRIHTSPSWRKAKQLEVEPKTEAMEESSLPAWSPWLARMFFMCIPGPPT